MLKRLLSLTAAVMMAAACQPAINTARAPGGSISFAAAFPEPSLRIQTIPDATRAIAVAMFSESDALELEAGLVLTPTQPSRRLGLLPVGKRRLLAVAFDAQAQPLAGGESTALIEAGKTATAELDLQPDFKLSDADLALLRALLRRPLTSPTPTPTPNSPSVTRPDEGVMPSPVTQPVASPSAASPSPSATPMPSPSPTAAWQSSGGGGGGGGGFVAPDPSPTPSGPSLGGDVNVQNGDPNLPPISAGFRGLL